MAEPIPQYAMEFAAGEIIPETYTRGHERIVTLGTLAGVTVMLYLDVSLARERVAEPRTSTTRGFGFERIMSEKAVPATRERDPSLSHPVLASASRRGCCRAKIAHLGDTLDLLSPVCCQPEGRSADALALIDAGEPGGSGCQP